MCLKKAAHLILKITGLFDRVPIFVLSFVARVAIAVPFWKSGQTKIAKIDGNWQITENTFYMFEDDFLIALFKNSDDPFVLIAPVLAAYMATLAELIIPLLLVLGLATRFGALALLGMTSVIQIFVYPHLWPVHLLWASILLFIIARGPGVLSVDYVLTSRYKNREK